MRLYIDLDTLGFVESDSFPRPVTALPLKRGDNVPVDLYFVRGNTIQELAAGATGQIGIKPRSQFGSSFFLALDADWTMSGSGTTAVYSFALNLNTTEIHSAFLAEPVSVLAMLEIEWVENGLRTSSATLDIEIQNDVNRGNEGMPTEANPPYPASTDILTKSGNLTGLTDAAAARTNLELDAIYDATNAQRLAGTNGTRAFVAGDRVRVTDQANRLEQFLGGTVGDNANWLVLENTLQVFIYIGSASNFTIEGQSPVAVPLNTLTSIGWAKLGALITSNVSSTYSQINGGAIRDAAGNLIMGVNQVYNHWRASSGTSDGFPAFRVFAPSGPPRGQARYSSSSSLP